MAKKKSAPARKPGARKPAARPKANAPKRKSAAARSPSRRPASKKPARNPAAMEGRTGAIERRPPTGLSNWIASGLDITTKTPLTG